MLGELFFFSSSFAFHSANQRYLIPTVYRGAEDARGERQMSDVFAWKGVVGDDGSSLSSASSSSAVGSGRAK